LPLPKGKKFPPPAGWTGIGAPYPTPDEQQALLIGNDDGNWCLRLAPDIIGIDVDGYHGGMVEGLPPTLTINSGRSDSATYLYRVPSGCVWKSSLGPGVDIIQASHRYVVIPPSIHPLGTAYVAMSGTNNMVADLPERFIADLRGEGMNRTEQSARPLGLVPVDEPPSTPLGQAELRDALLIPANGRHDRLVSICVRCSHLWVEGHLNAWDTLMRIEAWWDATMDDPKRKNESDRAWKWALAQRTPRPKTDDKEEDDEPERERDKTIHWVDWANPSVDGPVTWHVPMLVPNDHLIAIYGPAATGKSTVALAIAVACAKSGATVTYIDQEMREGQQRDRMEHFGWLEDPEAEWLTKFRLGYPINKPSLDLDPVSVSRMVDWCAGSDVVVMDSVSKFVGGDENAAQTWEAIDVCMKALRPATVIWIDHVSHAAMRQRGSITKLNNCDMTYELLPVADNSWEFICRKQRFVVGSPNYVVSRLWSLAPGGLS
jgi:hypothetical protein